jgi:hypothetical protein
LDDRVEQVSMQGIKEVFGFFAGGAREKAPEFEIPLFARLMRSIFLGHKFKIRNPLLCALGGYRGHILAASIERRFYFTV